MKEHTTHTISIFTANKPGVLVRIAQVFARRTFNIDSLVVSSALDGRFARMTITAKGDPGSLEQIIKQVAKLVDILHASEHLEGNAVEKELALFKMGVTNQTRTAILQLVEHFKAQTIDFAEESLVIQVTGSTEKIDAFEQMLIKYDMIEKVRTGKILMARGRECT